MNLEFVFRAGSEQVIVWHGDEKIGTFKANEFVTAMNQGHIRAYRNNDPNTVLLNDYVVEKT